MSGIILGTILGINIIRVSSQACLLVNQSPNNPVGADCVTSFFDLINNPTSDCICCNAGVIDDNPADECLFAIPPTLSKMASGTLTCNENFDCCSCDSLICNNCVTVECAGDSSCIGVDEIIINDGCDNQGVDIVCGGDLSCFRTGMVGECIKSIVCNGDNSCGESTFMFNQNIAVPNTINTLELPFNGDDSAPGTIIFANNVNKISCSGDRSCPDTEFTINCATNNLDVGCTIEIGGDNAAGNAIWNIENADKISCAGDDSCPNSEFTIDCVPNGCEVTINGDKAALNSDWDITNVDRFSCSSENGCGGGKYKLDCLDTGCFIECSSSCPNTKFKVTNSRGVLCNGVILVNDVISDGGCEKGVFRLDNNIAGSIICDSTFACKNAKFTGKTIADIITNIEGVKCSSDESCKKALFRVSPIDADFNFECGGVRSCKRVNVTINTLFNSIKSFDCNAQNACKDATVLIQNIGLPLTVNELNIGGMRGAQGAVFIIQSEGNIVLDKVTCSGERSCRDIQINIDLLSASNTLTINNLECGAMMSCVRADVNIFRNGMLLSIPEVNALNIVINCNVGNACTDANVNGIPFTSF